MLADSDIIWCGTDVGIYYIQNGKIFYAPNILSKDQITIHSVKRLFRDSYGNIFNGRINRIEGYAQANAQIQLDGPSDRWFVRGFIQNIFDNSAITGLYVTDQSSGLFTNIFTLEPRRYGIAAGVKF